MECKQTVTPGSGKRCCYQGHKQFDTADIALKSFDQIIETSAKQ
jgi:hypothetical protein